MSNSQSLTVANDNDNEDAQQQQTNLLPLDDRCNVRDQAHHRVDSEIINSLEVAPGLNTNESAAALLPRTQDGMHVDMMDGEISPDEVYESVVPDEDTSYDTHEDEMHEAVVDDDVTPDNIHEAVVADDVTSDKIHEAVVDEDERNKDSCIFETGVLISVEKQKVTEGILAPKSDNNILIINEQSREYCRYTTEEQITTNSLSTENNTVLLHQEYPLLDRKEMTEQSSESPEKQQAVMHLADKGNSSLSKNEFKVVDHANKIIDTIGPTKYPGIEVYTCENLTNTNVNEGVDKLNKEPTSICFPEDKRGSMNNDECGDETKQVKISYPLETKTSLTCNEASDLNGESLTNQDPNLKNSTSDWQKGIHGPNQSHEAHATVDDTSWASASTSISTVNSEIRDSKTGILTTDQNSIDPQFTDGSRHFTENFKSALVSAETNASSPSTSAEHTYQPLRRARLRIGNQIQNLQEQLKTASSSGSSKTIEKLKQQLIEAKEMSMSFENIRKQRSISRPTKPTSHHLSHLTTPGKVERPYRQWQTLSPCVSTDSRYIFSSKEDRKSKLTPLMKVKVKTSDHLYAKRFQNLTGNPIPEGPKALVKIVEDAQDMQSSSSKAMCDSDEDASLFPCTKQLVSQIETREPEPNPVTLSNAISNENGTVEFAVLKPSSSNPTVKAFDRGSTVELKRSSLETVALGREAAFYHRKDKITDNTALGRRHSMLISGTSKPYKSQSNVDDDLSFLDLHNKQLTMNERFERASKRINAKPKTDRQQRIVGPPASEAIEMLSPLSSRDRQRSPGTTMLSLASDTVYGPDDDADSLPSSTSKSRLSPTRKLPTYARGSRAHDTTPYHPLPTSQRSSASRTRQVDTQSRLRRHKERSLHRLAFRAGSRPPNYGVYMKAATEYIERVDHGVREDENSSLRKESEMQLNESSVTSFASIKSKEAPKPVLEHSNVDESTPGPQCETVENFMQKIHREKKKSKGSKYITVVATKDHPGQLPGQLSFRAGQAIQLRCPEFEPSDGLCYGHFKAGRFKKKKKGLFSISHVGFESDLLTAL